MNLYILKGTSRKDGVIYKIGITTDLPARIKSIRSRSAVKDARKWLILPLWWAKYYEGVLHKHYDHLRRPQEGDGGTEWFKVLPFRPAFWLLYYYLLQTFLILILFVLLLFPYVYYLFFV